MPVLRACLRLLLLFVLFALFVGKSAAQELHGSSTFTGTLRLNQITNQAQALGDLNPASDTSISLSHAIITLKGLGTTPLPWANLTGVPTTLSGYGITDAQPHSTALDKVATNQSGGVNLNLETWTFASLGSTALNADNMTSGTLGHLWGGAGGVTGLMKSTSGVVSAATAGTDYLTPTGSGAGLTGIPTSAVTGGLFQATATQTYTLIVEGDSIPAGHGATHPWSYYLAAMPFFSGHTVRNVCRDSERIPTGSNGGNNLEDHYPFDAYPHRPTASGGDGGDLAIDVIGIGDNDIREGTSSADVITQLQSAVTSRQGDGFRVVLCTLWARGDPVNWDSGNEATRLAVNAAIRAGQITADQIFDVAAEFGDTSDTTFFQSDHSHPTDAAHKRIADLLHSIFLAGGGFRPGIAVGKFEQDIKVNGGVTASGAANITGAVAGGSDGMFGDRLGAANGLRVGGAYNGTWTGLVDLNMATVIHPAAGGYGLVLGDAGDPLSINGYGAAVVKIGSTSAHQIMLAGYAGGVVMMGGGSFPTTTGEQCQVNGSSRLGVSGGTDRTTVANFFSLVPRSAPGTPAEGDIYVDSSDHHIKCYLSGAWKQLDN